MDAIQGGISAHSFLFALTISCLGLLLDRCETSNWWLSQVKLQFLSALIPAWWPVATTLICLFLFLFSIFLCHCCWHCRSHCLWLFKILVYLLSVVTTWMVQGLQVSILYVVLWLVLCGDTSCLWKWSCLFCKQSLISLQVSWFYGFATRGDISVRIRAGFNTFPSLMFVESALHSSLFYYGFF